MTILCLTAWIVALAAQPAAIDQPSSTAKSSPPVRAVIVDLKTPNLRNADPPLIKPSAEMLQRAIPALERDKIDLVVIRVDIQETGRAAPPDALGRVGELVDVFQDQYAPRFRIVAWIRCGTGPDALAVWGIAEHYYMDMGIYGAMVPSRADDPMQSLEGKDLERWLSLGDLASGHARRHPAIVRAMLAGEPLSADIADGEVNWRRDTRGASVLNPEHRVLCLNADQASRFKIARAIADTPEELAAALGYKQVEWVPFTVAEPR